MKIICVGRNYSEHAKELNNDIPESPVIFLKPDTALVKNDDPVYIPDFTSDLHHEIELVIKINKAGKHINKNFANNYIGEITVGIDFTARDLQSDCKKMGLPWEIAKAFDNSAVIGSFKNYEPDKIYAFHLNVNGLQKQHGLSSEMLFSIQDIVSYVSRFFTLKVGDLIFTGTPAGVGPVIIGDELEGYLDNNRMFKCSIK
jgi:2-keto-4-pentenoate hydratase/2-oxohepta-3-ene-1,7-dioic acid hydratase in catechol pathway